MRTLAALLFLVGCGGGGGPADTGGIDAAADVGDSSMPDVGGDALPPDAANPDANVEREPDTDIGDESFERWVFMQSHLHTTGFHGCANDPVDPGPLPEGQCYSGEGVTAFLEAALLNAASDMIITDHNNIDAWFDAAFTPLANADRSAYATPLRGLEWSSLDGHMTLMWPTEALPSNAEALSRDFIFVPGNLANVAGDGDYESVIDAVHASGGVVIINHPELLVHIYPEDTFDADGVEVGIPPNPLDDGSGGFGVQSSKEARDWWQRRLVEGQRLAGTAGADHHHGGGDIPGLEAPIFGTAVNYVRIDPALPRPASVDDALSDPEGTIAAHGNAMVDAIRRGHIMVVENETAPRVYVGVDLDGDGRFHDARAGDCVLPDQLAGLDMIRIRLRIVGSTPATFSSHFNLLAWTDADDGAEVWKREVDYDDGFESAAEYEIDAEDAFTIEMDVPIDPSERGFIRFVLERDIIGPVNDTEAVTQPIYFGDWGQECEGASPLY